MFRIITIVLVIESGVEKCMSFSCVSQRIALIEQVVCLIGENPVDPNVDNCVDNHH